ncbi:MAG: hypothetical protein DRP87_05495 [Spirochaetes bacterium]|nr:MAG: hypothetical protein DRP87_05495 [Spirochaetota bacterium]
MDIGTRNNNPNVGKLKIGDNWNAITIIALSQTNPLKAIAEFVENSIDANAKNITIIRGKQKGETYLKVIDDGDGIDDFEYVATHIGSSIKRELKKKGITGIQGEFGIGLLSFWTVGEELIITSMGREEVIRRMKLVRNNPGYSISEAKTLFNHTGTKLFIHPVLPGVRQLSGEKIQNYLASELRDRISKRDITIRIIDRTSRKELIVEPRKFKGRLLHHLPEVRSPLGEIYTEIYLNDPSSENQVGLYKTGTRVIPSIRQIEQLNVFPWNSPYLEGIIDVSFLQLTPGTRDGIIYDSSFESFLNSLTDLGKALSEIIEEQKKAEEEKASRTILKKISRAIRKALIYLPEDEYSWLEVKPKQKIEVLRKGDSTGSPGEGTEPPSGDGEEGVVYLAGAEQAKEELQKEFFEFAGPLYSVRISPAKVIVKTSDTRRLRAVACDKKGRQVESSLKLRWEIVEGEGTLSAEDMEYARFTAPSEPGITRIKVTAIQKDLLCEAESIITITEELFQTGEKNRDTSAKKGLPGYTFKKSPGELWRSYYDVDNYVIVINNGHADYIYASKSRSRKLNYIAKLFAKELVFANFPEATKEQLLERMIELQLYTEDYL